MNKLHSLFFVIAILFLVCSVTSANERIDDGSEGRHNMQEPIVNDENTDGERDTGAGLIQRDIMYDERDTDVAHDLDNSNVNDENMDGERDTGAGLIQRDIMYDESDTDVAHDLVDSDDAEELIEDDVSTAPSRTDEGIDDESVTEGVEEVTEEELNDFKKIIEKGYVEIVKHIETLDKNKGRALVLKSQEELRGKLSIVEGIELLEMVREKSAVVTEELTEEEVAFQVWRDAAVEELDEKLVKGKEAVVSHLTSLKKREVVFLYAVREVQLKAVLGNTEYTNLLERSLGMEDLDEAIETSTDAVRTFLRSDSISAYIRYKMVERRYDAIVEMYEDGDEFDGIETGLWNGYADSVEERIPLPPAFSGVLPTSTETDTETDTETVTRNLRGRAE